MDADLSKTVCIVGWQGEDAMKKWCRIFLLSLLLCIAMCAGAQAAEHDMLKVGLKYGSTELLALWRLRAGILRLVAQLCAAHGAACEL